MPETNMINLSGKIISVEESHRFENETFYKFTIEVPRLSGASDELPFVASEKLLYNNEVVVGDFVRASGQIRTKNQKEDRNKKLLVFGYMNEIIKIDEETLNNTEIKNEVLIEGFLCKKPTNRDTKSGRKISDLIIAVNRNHNKSDYIPGIAWGVNSSFARNLKVGEKVSLSGRFQSRSFYRKDENGNPVPHTALEVSISKLGVVETEK